MNVGHGMDNLSRVLLGLNMGIALTAHQFGVFGLWIVIVYPVFEITTAMGEARKREAK